MTSADLTNYINSYQKEHDKDPKQSWIATQRTYGYPLLKFFKWLAYPKLTAKERNRLPRDKYPDVLQGFDLQRKKGAKTPVENKDIWNDKDTAIFLKYCTDKPRVQFYHALTYQTSARPGELLQLKIGDIADNIQLDDDDKPFAYIDVGRYGKRKESRFPLITEFISNTITDICQHTTLTLQIERRFYLLAKSIVLSLAILCYPEMG